MDLFFDTETTGFPKRGAPLDDRGQPDIVQLGMLLVDDRTVRGELNLIIYPRGDIPAETTAVHGITVDIATRCGVFPATCISVFDQLVGHADRLIAHNLAFDLFLMKAMYAREWHNPYDDGGVPKICTMRSAEGVCRLPKPSGRPGYKWPTLEEAYKMLVDPTGFEGAHDALSDVKACARVLWALEDGGYPLFELGEKERR